MHRHGFLVNANKKRVNIFCWRVIVNKLRNENTHEYLFASNEGPTGCSFRDP